MSDLYTIPISGLKEGHHTFEFEVNKEFFDLFEESEIKEGELSVIAEAEKRSTCVDIDISISGKVKICCDRCLEMFDHPITCENRLVVRFGKEIDDSDPEIIIVPRDYHELDLKQYLYEFIHLALPIKRIHPNDENGESTCDPDMIRKLNEHLIQEENKSDPRWNELKKLMNDN